jgi:hypothetical protein
MRKAYNTATLSLRLPDNLDKQLTKIADKKSLPLGSLCRMILAEWVQNNAGSLLIDELEPKPTQAPTPAITKPAPPKAQGRPKRFEYTEDDRALDAWVRANEITVDKPAEYGDDWI